MKQAAPAASEPSRALDTKIMRGSAWHTLSFGSSQILSVLAMLVLVRLLEPEAFGLFALAWTFLAALESIQGSGLGAALIYRRHGVEQAAASALVFLPAAGLALYGASFAAAPLLARVFHSPDLTDVVRIMAVLLVVRALGVVPGAILERNIDFRSRAKAELSAAFVQVSTSLTLAFTGFGVWSLVFGHIAAGAVGVSLLWLFVPWRPKPADASWRTLRELVRYGRFVAGARVVNLLNNTLDTLAVGRLLGPVLLGFYTVTHRLANLPNAVIAQVVGRVMFSAYSTLQDDLPAFRRAYVQNLQRIALLALPVSVVLVVAAEPVVLALLGERWLVVVTPLRLLALWGLVKSFAGAGGAVWNAAGKPHVDLIFQVLHVLLIVPAVVLLTGRFELTGAALAMLAVDATTGIPGIAVTMRLLRLRARELGRALARPALCSGLLGATLTLLLPTGDSMPSFASLALLATVGLLVYLGSTALFARSVIAPMWASLRGASA